MGRVFLLDLDGRSYRCRFCYTPLVLADDVLSRSFNCSRGRAYLVSNVVNIMLGPQVERLMMSGMHTVEDVFCCCCGQILGWKYVVAHDKNEMYKEGKFVLERWRIVDDAAEELNPDARAGSSDSENA
ncbi:protein yippee-like At5g53940 [Gastrolobium bilobum]|uniref:protein yippee-like At5g53940 n=1 Tax=Gastrolobium bilobum TaxID=150636 RepID=UPI002AB17F58|nr:protein yippee-like At5g53940 [Gastrolobium bilobum]